MKKLLIMLFTILAMTGHAEASSLSVFYACAADLGDGSSEAQCGSIAELNTIMNSGGANDFATGAKIYFKAGDTFTTALDIEYCTNCTFTSYGTGAKPFFDMYSDMSTGTWTETAGGSNIWHTTCGTGTTRCYFNEDWKSGTRVNTQAACNSIYKYHVSGTTLSVYSDGDPDLHGTYSKIYSTKGQSVIWMKSTAGGATLEKIHARMGYQSISPQGNNQTIRNCDFERTGTGIYTKGATSSGLVVEGCYFYDIWNAGTYGGSPSGSGTGINLATTLTNCTARYNYLVNCYEGINPNANGCYVYGNVIYASYLTGINHAGIATGETTSPLNRIIASNSIYHSPTQTSGHGIACQTTGSNATIKNNAIYIYTTVAGSVADGIAISPDTLVGIDVDYNVIYRAPGSNGYPYQINGKKYNTIAEIRTAFAAIPAWTGAEANGQIADPKFIDVALKDLTLNYDSPCINAGINLGSTYDDILSPLSDFTDPDTIYTADQDIYGSGWEIGAYVYPEGLCGTLQ